MTNMRIDGAINSILDQVHHDTLGPGRLCQPTGGSHAACQHVHEAARAGAAPAPVAEQPPAPPRTEACDFDATGKWPWQLPPHRDEPPPAEPKVWSIPYPSPAEARTGNLLDLLA
ncbi:MAG: hypothetical protein WD118_04295 [Phycisphaeraceae bacterium]